MHIAFFTIITIIIIDTTVFPAVITMGFAFIADSTYGFIRTTVVIPISMLTAYTVFITSITDTTVAGMSVTTVCFTTDAMIVFEAHFTMRTLVIMITGCVPTTYTVLSTHITCAAIRGIYRTILMLTADTVFLTTVFTAYAVIFA